MNPQSMHQLEKILALADSTYDGEAVVAVRKARQMLLRDGLNFGDLARAAIKKPSRSLSLGLFSGVSVAQLECELAQLRQQIGDLQNDMQAQTLQAETWRHKAVELEQKLNTSQAEAHRWRQLARDTVEKLWDLGQSMQQDDNLADAPKAKSA